MIPPDFDALKRDGWERDGEISRVGAQLRNEYRYSAVVTLILANAYQEYSEAIDKFAEIDPTDWRAVAKLQSDIKRWVEINDWMKSALAKADIATQSIIDDMRAENPNL